MLTFLARRLLQSISALATLLVVVFFLTRLTGNPTNLYLPISASTEARLEFAEKHGFNDPLIVQFWRFISDLARGNFGESLYQGRPALDVVLEAYPVTLTLAALTLAIAISLAIILGSLAALRPNGILDRVLSMFTIVTATAPAFWIAIVAIVIFAIGLGWLPTSGMGPSPRYWIMPVGVLVLHPLGILTQVVRSNMVGALQSPYLKTAMAKGAGRLRLIFIHALRNALLPLVTVAGIQATGLVNGAVVVETIFGFPGIGNTMIESIRNRDFALSITCIIVAAVLIYLLNLLVDILYSRLDPRVRLR